MWSDEGWVFTDPVGAPLNMNTDHHMWKALLSQAGLRNSRLHDARHTAATALLLLGVPDRAVMGIMGWSDSGMAACYQHITAAVRRYLAGQDQLARLGPVFRSKDAVEAGMSWRDLYALRDRGEILQLSRGLYQQAAAAGGGDAGETSTSRRSAAESPTGRSAWIPPGLLGSER